MRGLPTAGKDGVMVDSHGKFVPLAPVLDTLFLRPASKKSDARQVAAVYFNRVNVVALSNLPDSFSDKTVLATDEDHVKPSLAVPPYSVPVPPEPARNAAAE